MISYKGLTVTEFVLYNEQNKGWIPALIVGINPPRSEKEAPTLNLVMFWTGMHDPSFQREAVEHGTKSGCWMMVGGAEEFEEQKKEEFEKLKVVPLLPDFPAPPAPPDPVEPTPPAPPAPPVEPVAAPVVEPPAPPVEPPVIEAPAEPAPEATPEETSKKKSK